MNIDPNAIKIVPVKDCILPEIQIQGQLQLLFGREVPLDISGTLFTEDMKKIADLRVISFDLARGIPIYPDENRSSNLDTRLFSFSVPVNERILSHIEVVRDKNPNKDVKLIGTIWVKILYSKVYASRDLHIAAKPPNQVYSSATSPDPEVTFLSTSGELGEIRTTSHQFQYTIHESVWIQEFCPPLQLGSFVLFEVPIVDSFPQNTEVNKKLNAAIATLGDMRKNYLLPDWNGVIRESRHICDLFRKDQEIRDLLIQEGYPAEVAKSFEDLLFKLFDFASKFAHKVSRDNTTMIPPFRSSREDAMLIYSLGCSIVALIGTRLRQRSELCLIHLFDQ